VTSSWFLIPQEVHTSSPFTGSSSQSDLQSRGWGHCSYWFPTWMFEMAVVVLMHTFSMTFTLRLLHFICTSGMLYYSTSRLQRPFFFAQDIFLILPSLN